MHGNVPNAVARYADAYHADQMARAAQDRAINAARRADEQSAKTYEALRRAADAANGV